MEGEETFVYVYIFMFAIVYHFKQHIPLILIKILRRRIHYPLLPCYFDNDTVIIGAGVWTADDHNSGIALEETEVTDWRFEEVTIFF